MRDADTGKLMWAKDNWNNDHNDVTDGTLADVQSFYTVRSVCVWYITNIVTLRRVDYDNYMTNWFWYSFQHTLTLIHLSLYLNIYIVVLPKSILSLRAVTREINFSSAEMLSKFRIVQKIMLQEMQLEGMYYNLYIYTSIYI